MKFETDADDFDTVSAYHMQVQRERGYTGPCFICMPRLESLYMAYAGQIVQNRLIQLGILPESGVKPSRQPGR